MTKRVGGKSLQILCLLPRAAYNANLCSAGTYTPMKDDSRAKRMEACVGAIRHTAEGVLLVPLMELSAARKFRADQHEVYTPPQNYVSQHRPLLDDSIKTARIQLASTPLCPQRWMSVVTPS